MNQEVDLSNIHDNSETFKTVELKSYSDNKVPNGTVVDKPITAAPQLVETTSNLDEVRDIEHKISNKTETLNEKDVHIHNNEESNSAVKESGDSAVISEPKNEEEQWEDLLGSGSIMKQILKKGEPGTRPSKTQSCFINYECRLLDGRVVEKHDNFELELGCAEVVQGLDVAIGLMEVGEVCLLKIEPRLAYGSKGLEETDPQISPNVTVCFQVELVKVLPEEEPEDLPIDDRKAKGNRKRERGNWWYKRGDNQLAIQCYRKALDYLDDVDGGVQIPEEISYKLSDEELQKFLEARVTVHNNMAAAQIKLQLYDAALVSLQNVLRCQPQNVKALFRKAKVYRAKNDIPLAIKIVNKALGYAPDDKDLLNELASLEKLQQKQRESEKNLARKMFGDINNFNANKKKSTSKFYAWASMGVTMASVTIGILALLIYRSKYSV